MNRNLIASFFRLNPETILGNKPVVGPFGLCTGCCDAFCSEGHDFCDECAQLDKLKAAAGKHRDIVLEENPYLPPSQRYEAHDRVSFDYEPGARFHIVSRGGTKAEAIHGLLQDLAEAELASAADKRHIQTEFHRFQPPEVVAVRSDSGDDE